MTGCKNSATGDATLTDLNATKAIEQVMGLKCKIEEIQSIQRKGEIDLLNHELNKGNDSGRKEEEDDGDDDGDQNGDKENDQDCESHPK